MNKFITIKLFTLCLYILSSTVSSQENSLKFSAPADKKIFVLPIPNQKISLQSEITLTVGGSILTSTTAAVTLWYKVSLSVCFISS